MAGRLHSLLCRQLKLSSTFQSSSYRRICQLSSDISSRVSASSRRPVRPFSYFGHVVLFQAKGGLLGGSSKCYSTSGLLSSVWDSISFKVRMRYPKYMLRRSSLHLYLCCVELIDHDLFMRDFEMPDTFNSWFRITELHIWLCMVRLAQEGKEGEFVRNNMIQFMWQDIEKKAKKLSEGMGSSLSSRREGVQALAEQFKAVLYAYDEGLLSDDKVLAGAIWRNFFERNCKDVEYLERMVEYVRKQLANVDKMESNVVLTSGLMVFTPLYETPEAVERYKQILAQIMKRL